jgi:malonate decarboxylase beta subunit
MLAERTERFGHMAEPMDIWRALGIDDPASVPLLEADAFVALAASRRAGRG